MRPDELKQITRWMWALRPDLAKLDWQDEADELETLVALAVWRSRPVVSRVQGLIDALDVARLPPPVPARCGALEDVASVEEWGPAG